MWPYPKNIPGPEIHHRYIESQRVLSLVKKNFKKCETKRA
jgi:hypothetical protein